MVSRKSRIAAWGALAAAVLPFATPLAAQSANGVGSPFELAFWQSVAGSEDPAVYDAYLQQYPAGTFAGLARAKVASLRQSAPAPAVTPPAAAPAPQPAATPALAAAPAPAPAPAPAASAEPTQAASDAALLTELARSQEPGACCRLCAWLPELRVTGVKLK